MNLRHYLFINKISQRKFAEKLNIPSSVLWSFIHGRRVPSIEMVYRIHVVSGGNVTFMDWVSMLNIPMQTSQKLALRYDEVEKDTKDQHDAQDYGLKIGVASEATGYLDPDILHVPNVI